MSGIHLFVDHSGYGLYNVGDFAMLESAVIRIRRYLPDANLYVPTSNPERLATRFPFVVPVASAIRGFDRNSRIEKAKNRIASNARPGMPGFIVNERLSGYGLGVLPEFRDAFLSADAVVAAGGGYLCDTFRTHGIRVLSLLREAQRRGKPTAMFGQGIGPVADASLNRLLVRTLPNLNALGLRTPWSDPGLPGLECEITGDDALAILDFPQGEGLGIGKEGICVNFRLASYNGASQALVDSARSILREWARGNGLTVHHALIDRQVDTGLESYDDQSLCSPNTDFAGVAPSSSVSVGLDSAVESILASSSTLTMSYHAAVFSLALGRPVVGLSASAYYDGKFSGLASLYGTDMMRTVRLDGSLSQTLPRALDEAREQVGGTREKSAELTRELRDTSERLYRGFLMDL